MSITATGLSSVLKSKSEKNFVSVCDEKCVFDEASSTEAVAKCKVPKLSTAYSNSNFKITEATENLRANKYFGSNSDFMKVFDQNVMTNSADLNSNCFIGM